MLNALIDVKLYVIFQDLDYELRRQSGEGNAYVGLRLAKSTTSQEDVNNETSLQKPSEDTNVSDLLTLQVNVNCLRYFNYLEIL